LLPATTTVNSILNSVLYRYLCVVFYEYCLEFVMASGKKAGKRAVAASNSLVALQSAFDKPTKAAHRSP
jgi:hypothetical protein